MNRPTDWRGWLTTYFERHVGGGFSAYHEEFWDWVWSITPQHNAAPYVACWPRGSGKSTGAELGCVAVGSREARRYVLYVSGTQDQADDHVSNIASMLESKQFGDIYPSVADRLVGKYGASRGWRRNRLRSASGFTVDAIGLDAAMRGAKLEDARPDLIVLDDVDSELDSQETIDRKIVALTRKILPALAPHGAVLVVQNLVHPEGIMTRLVDGRADFLARRMVSGPHPALQGMTYERQDSRVILTGGVPTWDYMSLERCQAVVDEIGLRAFLAECQQQVEQAGQPRFNREAIAQHRLSCRPPLPWTVLPDWAHAPGLDVWELPRPGESYVMMTDAAEGKGLDYTVTVILERLTRRHVLTLRDNTREPSVHGAIAVRAAYEYNLPLWGIFRAFGGAVMAAAANYPNLYWHEDRPQTRAQQLTGTRPTERMGYQETQATTRELIEELAVAIETYALHSPAEGFWRECDTFIVNKDGKAEAAPGAHDDYPRAMMGALRMTKQMGATAQEYSTAELTASYGKRR